MNWKKQFLCLDIIISHLMSKSSPSLLLQQRRLDCQQKEREDDSFSRTCLFCNRHFHFSRPLQFAVSQPGLLLTLDSLLVMSTICICLFFLWSVNITTKMALYMKLFGYSLLNILQYCFSGDNFISKLSVMSDFVWCNIIFHFDDSYLFLFIKLLVTG